MKKLMKNTAGFLGHSGNKRNEEAYVCAAAAVADRVFLHCTMLFLC